MMNRNLVFMTGNRTRIRGFGERLRQRTNRHFRMWAVWLLLLMLVPLHGYAQETFTGSDGVDVLVSDRSRIVSVGSALTETIYALNAAEHLVAVDESSMYPAAAAELPNVPFTRNLSAEGILSFSPTVVLASGASGPPTAIQQIRGAGTPMLLFPAEESEEGAFERVRLLGDVLDRSEEAEVLVSGMEADLAQAAERRGELDRRPIVLFIYARGPNSLMVAGRETAASKMVDLAGGENAFTEFEGYKPLTSEAVVQADPEIILMMRSGMSQVGGREGVLRAPGVGLTRAGESMRIHAMDGTYLLGFGPRLGEAVLELMDLFHPGELGNQ
ncbi:MAG: ABC transporter substrate-binding protein [Balneolaceae bacterium]